MNDLGDFIIKVWPVSNYGKQFWATAPPPAILRPWINWRPSSANFSITAFHLRSTALNDSFYLAGKLIHVFLKKITATQDIDISQIKKASHLLLSSWYPMFNELLLNMRCF